MVDVCPVYLYTCVCMFVYDVPLHEYLQYACIARVCGVYIEQDGWAVTNILDVMAGELIAAGTSRCAPRIHTN